jgi:peptidoglycan/xylan/chitin deacetylase (PgdA/CDA1 family)
VAAGSLILCYHAVSDEWPERFAVSTGQLGEQVEHLLGRGYRPATFAEAVAGTVPRALAVTFDDAFRSVPERALPVLSDLGVPATVFVSTSLVDVPLHIGYEQWLDTPHRDELVAASWDQLGSLIEAGWEIGSHTQSHPYLTRLDDESLHRELRESRAELQHRLGRPCRTLAYPYADVDARVVDAARAAGYAAAATIFGCFHAARDPLRQPRVVVYRHNSQTRFMLKARPRLHAVMASRPIRAIRRVSAASERARR